MRREAKHFKGVAHAVERAAEDQQAVADEVDDAVVLCGVGVGGERDVGQHDAGQAALGAHALREDGGRFAVVAAVVVYAETHPGIQVQFFALQ